MEGTSRFVKEVDRALEKGKLREPFNAACVRQVFKVVKVTPPFADKTFNSFLPKHEKDKAPHNKVKAYFERVGPVGSGLYRRCCN